jgi:hypothetical protein
MANETYQAKAEQIDLYGRWAGKEITQRPRRQVTPFEDLRLFEEMRKEVRKGIGQLLSAKPA